MAKKKVNLQGGTALDYFVWIGAGEENYLWCEKDKVHALVFNVEEAEAAITILRNMIDKVEVYKAEAEKAETGKLIRSTEKKVATKKKAGKKAAKKKASKKNA